MIYSFLMRLGIRNLVYAGVTKGMSLETSHGLQIANFASLIAVIVNIGYTLLFYFSGHTLVALTNAPSAFFIALSIYLNHKKFYRVSKFLLFVTVPLAVFVISVLFIGNLLGGHIYFLLFAILPFTNLSYSDRYLIAVYFIINIFCFFYVEYFTVPLFLPANSSFLDVHTQSLFRGIAVAVTFSALSFVLLYFLRNTHRNQAELVKTNLYKDKIFSILAHDLKGPIGSMGTFLGILVEQKNNMSEEDVIKGLKELQKNANQSYVILENVLDWVRKDSNKIRYQPDHVKLHRLVRETLDLLQIQCSEKQIVFEVNVSEEHFPYADERMTSTVLRNVFSNAIKFSNPNSRIKIDSKDSGEFIELHVQDFGIGIAKNKLEEILKQVQPSSSSFGTMGEKGTGLGLVVAFDLIRQQNGKFDMESELGFGTKFTIHLPKVN
ncbi:sensor histidine kinase [Leptospira idonii]|uniref:histidine kinase n=1 Tax=Leptospira idonii TaxID=1193500 RepID=A0A4R9M297_9LEPT|nr:HAMP domain-containing sensor histidine kinase [Leptospira idonii]TGN19985.1 sensor histidine kinase [Leptospira idonii]